MKRSIVVLMILATVSAFVGAAPLAQNEAWVLVNGSAVWQEKGGKLTWLENLTIGDKVTLTSRVSKFKQDGDDREFIKVKAPDGKEGWVRTLMLSMKSSLAVVKVDKSLVYSEPREVKITSKYISNMTLVAVLQDGSTGSFAKVQAYDRAQKRFFTDATFVSVDDLTTSDVDINATILYTTAVSSDDQGIKKNLLKVAITKYGGTVFLPMIQAAAGLEPVVAKDLTPASGTFVVNDDDVNIRSIPDEKSGQVVGKLAKGAKVDVSEKTSQTYTVGDSTAPWYHIKSPDGWVFGSFLDSAE